MRAVGALVIGAMLFGMGCGGSGTESSVPAASTMKEPIAAGMFTPDELEVIFTMSPLPPVPRDPTNRVADDARAAHFGQFLFFDPRMSGSGRISCASCHDPVENWGDGLRTPDAFGPELRHVPSLWNVAYNRWYFWDGRADSLWAQALEPLEHRREHAGSRGQYARLVYDDPQLRTAYERIFGPMPDMTDVARFPNAAPWTPAKPGASATADRAVVDLVFVNLSKAMAAYQRKLVSRRSPFDVFVEGLKSGDAAKLGELSPSAQRGLKLFIGRANCRSCHHGPTFTDGEFHDNGILDAFPTETADLGRFQGINNLLGSPFNAMGEYNDDPAGKSRHPTSFVVNQLERRGQFKTPTLRNSAVTAPYMHRGQLETLEDVVQFYSTLRAPGQDGVQAAIAKEMRERSQRTTKPGHTHGAGGSGGGEHVLIAIHLSKGESDDLLEFLRSLTDVDIDPGLREAPESPLN